MYEIGQRKLDSFLTATIFDDDKESSKIIYRHADNDYTVEYFESVKRKDDMVIYGKEAYQIINDIFKKAAEEGKTIIFRGAVAHHKKEN